MLMDDLNWRCVLRFFLMCGNSYMLIRKLCGASSNVTVGCHKRSSDLLPFCRLTLVRQCAGWLAKNARVLERTL